MSCEALFFTAPWCDPCHQAAPIFSEVTRELNIPASIIDTDLSGDLADGYGVESLPAVVVVCEDQDPSILVGSRPKAELRDFLRRVTGEHGSGMSPRVAD